MASHASTVTVTGGASVEKVTGAKEGDVVETPAAEADEEGTAEVARVVGATEASLTLVSMKFPPG